MKNTSIRALRPLSRLGAGLALAGLLGAFSSGNALAGVITYDNTVFAGISTNLTAVGSPALPFTDTDGRTTSKTGSFALIVNGLGLLTSAPTTVAITFANLAAGTNQFGFSGRTTGGNLSIASVLFDNGDSFSPPNPMTSSSQFHAFANTSSFTSVTVNIVGSTSLMLTDFRTATTSASVPEPSSLALIAGGAMFAGASAWRRRKAS